MYTENNETLLKEMKEDINKWKSALGSCMGKLSVVSVSVQPKMTYRFHTVSAKVLEKALQKYKIASQNSEGIPKAPR